MCKTDCGCVNNNETKEDNTISTNMCRDTQYTKTNTNTVGCEDSSCVVRMNIKTIKEDRVT